MEREIKELVTDFGTKISYYGYITGKEVNAIKNVIFDGINLSNGPEGKPNIQEYPLKTVVAREREMIKQLVTSVNGVTENVFDKVENLRAEEYKQIVETLEPIVKGHF